MQGISIIGLEAGWCFLRMLEKESANDALSVANPGQCTMGDLLAHARQLGLLFSEDDPREASIPGDDPIGMTNQSMTWRHKVSI